MEVERQQALTNRLRRLVHEDVHRAVNTQNPNLENVLAQIIVTLETLLLQSTSRDIRNEAMVRLLGKKGTLNKNEFRKHYLEVLEEHVEAGQAELGIILDDNGQLIARG